MDRRQFISLLALAVASPSVPVIPMRGALLDPSAAFFKAYAAAMQRHTDAVILAAFET